MPESHPKHLESTPQRLLNWGERIGPATCSIIRRLLEDKPHPEMGYRSCLGVFSLARRYGEDRLEAACARALVIGSPKRKTVQSILEAGLDRHADLFPAEATPLPTHGNVRGRITTTEYNNTPTLFQPTERIHQLHQHTLTTLKTLKLPGMAAAFEEQLIQPVTQSLSFDDRFGLIVDREASHRQPKAGALVEKRSVKTPRLRRGHRLPFWARVK